MESSSWSYAAGRVNVLAVFDTDMFQGSTPAVGSWQVKHDGVVNAVVANNWVGPRSLLLVGTPGAQPGVNVTLELLVADANLKDTGNVVIEPFGPVVVTPP